MTNKPIKIWLEKSARLVLYDIISCRYKQFELVAEPGQADVIVLEKDTPDYIKKTLEFKMWPQKCVVISECDNPTYFLPGCFASNRRSWLGKGRSITIPYFITQESCPNVFIKDIDVNAYPRYLYSFIGGSTSWVRKKLFKALNKYDNVYIHETNHYQHWNNDQSYIDKKAFLQKKYADVLEQSSFVLCPRGAGVSSIRLFEVMEAGRVPVIIADRWVPIVGIPWHNIALFIPENQLSKINNVIKSRQLEAEKMGRMAQQAWKEFCSPESVGELLSRSLRTIMEQRNEREEFFIRLIFPLVGAALRLQVRIFKVAKFLILNVFAFFNKKFPYSLNRPLEEQIKKT